MRGSRIVWWRLRTWWNARSDARYNLPPPGMNALGETEREIWSDVNTAISETEKEFSPRFRALEGELAERRQIQQETYEPEYRRFQRETNRQEPLSHLSSKTHHTLMGLITTGEVFFNNVAFDVFGKSAPTTFIMALAVGLSIPLCAYMAGLWLRQWPSPWHKTAIKFTALLGIVVFALFAVNTARLAHLETNPELAIDPRLNWAFLTMNIVMLAAVLILTYLTYDPVPGFKEVKSKWEKTLTSVHKLESQLNERADQFRAEVDMCQQAGWGLIAYYRKVNRRGRTEVPQYFDDDSNKNHRPEFIEVKELRRYYYS